MFHVKRLIIKRSTRPSYERVIGFRLAHERITGHVWTLSLCLWNRTVVMIWTKR
jgi:hypothetical protein